MPKTVSCKFSKKEQALLKKLFGIDQSDKSELDYYKATKWWKAELEIIQEDIASGITECAGNKHNKFRKDLMALFNKIQQCIELQMMQKERKQMASKKNPRRRKNTNTPPSSTWEKLGVMMDGTKLWKTLERQSEYRFMWSLYQHANGKWSFSGGESRNYWDNDGKGYTYQQALKLIKQFDDADSIEFDAYYEDFNNNPRRRKNGTDMKKYEIKLTKTQHNALRNWMVGSPTASPMYFLWGNAKKKSKSARTLTFMANNMFIDALIKELENSVRYTTKMNDRDWKALKSLRDQVKKLGMNDNPRKRKNAKSEAKRAMDMHHKEGISLKNAWAIVKGKKNPKRKNGTKKGQVRKTARRAYKKNPNKYTRKRASNGRMMYFKNGKICSKETYTKKL